MQLTLDSRLYRHISHRRLQKATFSNILAVATCWRAQHRQTLRQAVSPAQIFPKGNTLGK